MAAKKRKKIFICNECGHESLRWAGKCPSCGEWETLEEVELDDGKTPGKSSGDKDALPAKFVKIEDIKENEFKDRRISSKMGEVDRVLGGGLVPGEIVLISGEPGIGKSTLLLQVCLNLSQDDNVLYVSGEESVGQLSTRLNRVSKKKDLDDSNIMISDETDVDSIISLIEKEEPELVVIDSIQSVYTSDVSSFAGSISQVRECGMRLTNCAKKSRVPILLVGQVTKSGNVAGPKILEHVVDAVVYFEGDEFGMYRMLRGIKNRFGPTDEVGIFEMTSKGLIEVNDPTNVFCKDEESRESGVVLGAVFKGSRVLFVETQALTSYAAFGSPRRLATGLSKSRLDMLSAVLSRRAKIGLGEQDVFVNISGGMYIDDPTIDLAVCMAIASASKDVSLPADVVYVGEVGLSGNIREVPHMDKIRSAAKRRKLKIVSQPSGKDKSLKNLVKPLTK